MSESGKMLPGSYSGRNGASWSQSWSDDRRRSEAGVVGHVSASLQETITPPSREAMQRSISADLCPFCGAGPYKNLGLHTHLTHGVSAAELRDLAGLKRVCSEDLSDDSRRRLKGRADFAEMRRKGAAASVAKGAYETAHAASMAPRLEVIAERDPVIADRARRGDRLVDIAADLGVTVRVVQLSLKRQGVTPTLAQTNADRRERLQAGRDAASRTRLERDANRRTRRLERFEVLGGDWSAVIALAAEERVTTKGMRAFLVANGVDLDGRKDRHSNQVPTTSKHLSNHATTTPEGA